MAQGELFHRWAEQHILGMPVVVAEADEGLPAAWQRAFVAFCAALPVGRRFPEVSLAVPLGRHFLIGRFDLLILGEQHAHLFDWKTEHRPRSAAALAEDWQTRLYLALAAVGSPALGASYQPEQIALTYWFANAPDRPTTIRYTAAQHRQTWAELEATAERIDRLLTTTGAIWPLTDDLATCADCLYRTLCNRPGPLPGPGPDRPSADDGEQPLLRDEEPAELLQEPPLP